MFVNSHFCIKMLYVNEKKITKEEEENEEKGMERGGKGGRLPISSTILALFQVECF